MRELLAQARQLRLASDPIWLRLGHYRSTWFGGQHSEADGGPFFLAKDGKGDPAQELEATIRGFFGPDPADERLQHPQCRFPARFAWLDQALHFDRSLLPTRRCERLNEYRRLLRPGGLTLVFSSYYLNNPASAFGHTFLRVNKTARSSSEPRSELLDYGIDYSATVDTGNALLYAIKGLAGLFPGEFRKLPYYYKVREYNDFESRDLWEYDLALSTQQLERVVDHLWELGSTYFAYYYLSENCSYHILAALEVADPNIQLLSHVGWPVIPADTVKALLHNPGLVRAIHYRPSNRSQFRRRIDGLSPDEISELGKLLDDPEAPLVAPAAQQARVLDAAIDLLDIRQARDLVKAPGEGDLAAADHKQRLLERRAELAVMTEDAPLAPPFRKMPHLGHGSSRLGLGSGHLDQRGFYHLGSFRLALHDLADPVQGYPDTAQIEFLPLQLRYYIEQPRVTLEQISLIRVVSLTPVTQFDRSLSWQVDVGGTRLRDSACRDCFVAFGELAGGFAAQLFSEALVVYGMLGGRIHTPADGGYGDWLRVGVGPFGGLRLRFSDDLALVGRGHWLYQPWQDPDSTWAADGALRWQYTRDFAFGVEGSLTPVARSVQAQSYIYF